MNLEQRKIEFFKKLKTYNKYYLISNDKDFTNQHSKLNIICSKHNTCFTQDAQSALKYNSCRQCLFEKKTNTDTNKFIKKVKEIHNNKYIYDKVDYKGSRKKIIITCPQHGEFLQRPDVHLSGYGCQKCSIEKTSGGTFHSLDKIIQRFRLKHGNLYKYDKIKERLNSSDKLEIICPKHGSFFQTYPAHLREGCPICRNSYGELEIRNYLIRNKINFKQNYSFLNCYYKQRLRFDFFIEPNICIEFDGEQHFKPVSIFGGKEEFEKNQIRDKEKNKYCKNNNINLIRISYKDFDKIENILNKTIKGNKDGKNS
jgi:hypothetical protein